MKVSYGFPNIRLFGNSTLTVESNNGKISMEAHGLATRIMKPLFQKYFGVFESSQPVVYQNGQGVYSLYLPPIPSKAHSIVFENFIRRWLFKKRIADAVTIAVTKKCQCKCKHCSFPNITSKEKELTTDELKKVVRECIDMNVINITFTGGEPLLRSDLEEVIATVPPDRAVSLIFTNGLGLTPDRIKSLKRAGITGVQISLDSPNPDEHDEFRQMPGLFEAVKEGVRGALNAGLLVGLSTYATNEFVKEKKLTRIADLGASWGVHEITVFDAMPTGKFIDCENVMLTPQNRSELIREGRELGLKYKKKMYVVTQSWTNCNEGFAKFIGCLAGNLQFHVSYCGDFRPCDFTPFSMGNVRDTSVKELWHKITHHPAYRKHQANCRMQTPSFRQRYIDPIKDLSGPTVLIDEIERLSRV